MAQESSGARQVREGVSGAKRRHGAQTRWRDEYKQRGRAAKRRKEWGGGEGGAENEGKSEEWEAAGETSGRAGGKDGEPGRPARETYGVEKNMGQPCRAAIYVHSIATFYMISIRMLNSTNKFENISFFKTM